MIGKGIIVCGEYHKGERFKDFLSSTQIKDYMVSPKFARYKALHPEMFEISIEASEKGSLYHDAMESLVNTGTLDKWRNNLLVFEPPINAFLGEIKQLSNPFSCTGKAGGAEGTGGCGVEGVGEAGSVFVGEGTL